MPLSAQRVAYYRGVTRGFIRAPAGVRCLLGDCLPQDHRQAGNRRWQGRFGCMEYERHGRQGRKTGPIQIECRENTGHTNDGAA